MKAASALKCMEIQRCRSISAAFLIALLVPSAPAYATSQCPSEFGPKNPLVNVLGWFVVAVGTAIGWLFFAYLARRSRGKRWLSRTAMLVLGFFGMILVWMGGFGLALAYFFLQC